MSKIIIAGVDPGFTGGIVKLDPIDHTIEIADTPVFEIKTGAKKRRVLDHVGIANILDDERIVHLYLEEVNAMPGQGVVSMFNFGKSAGTIIGVCGGLRIPMTQVRPAKWKSDLRVPAEKNAARYRASEYFPQCSKAWTKAKDDGRAEATLIAFYGFCQLGYRIEKPFTLIGDLA